MDTIQLLEQYGNYVYAVVILFGGVWGVNYFPLHWATKYKFILFSSIWAIVFIGIEAIVQKTFNPENAIRYFLTYTVVTSVYELILKKLFIKWGLVDDDKPKQ